MKFIEKYNVPRIRIEADKKAVIKDYLTTEINNNHNTDKAMNRFCFYTVLANVIYG